VRLPFSAGVKKTEFAEHFMVLEDSDIDILLGEPALRHAHALTIDPDHENPPEHDVVGRMRALTMSCLFSVYTFLP
jgi:hypothetical protein